MSEIEIRLADANKQMRREYLMRRVLDGLRSTVQKWPIAPDARVELVRVEFTDASARYLAPLLEAVDILEAIVFASDGCHGHRNCAHSMEPWQRARALLRGKWEAEENREAWPPVDSTTS